MGEKPLTPTQILAVNLVRVRAERERSQRALAEGMRLVGGHKWTDVTVSNVERGERSVSVDELGALAYILGAKPIELLTPPPDPYKGLVPFTEVQIGPGHTIEKELYAAWVEGFGSLRYDAGKVTYDSDLAYEFFKRAGMLIQSDEEEGN